MLVTVTIAIAHHQRRIQWRAGGSSSGGDDAPCTIVSRLFTFVIGLVVVIAALAVAIRQVKPARRDQDEDISRWQRIRSGFLLVTLITALGVATALVLLVAGAIIVTGLRTAVQ